MQTRNISRGIRLKDVTYDPNHAGEEELPEIYDGRSQEEFQLGLALFFMVDMDENPEEYIDMDLEKIQDTIDAAMAFWKMKYDNERHWSVSD
jgi:hypothetical protein